jgi:hypothetical protein
MRLSSLLGLAPALLVTGLVGCSSVRTDQPGTADRPGSGASASISASTPVATPSLVTKRDYEQAVRLMGDCAADNDVELVNGGWDPVTNQRMMLGWNAPGMTADESADIVRRCRAAHLDAVEARYAAQHPARMSPELMSAVRNCLTDQGLSVSGHERTAQDLLKTVPEGDQEKLLRCVHTEAYKVYPDLQAITFPGS